MAKRARCQWHNPKGDPLGCDGRHCHPHSVGTEIEKRVGDVSFLLKFKRRELGELLIKLWDCDYFYLTSCFQLSFCIDCGAFLRVGVSYELCWRCKEQLEDHEEAEEEW